MDNGIFERNILALSKRDPDLRLKFSGFGTVSGKYKFLKSASGDIIPALTDPGGTSRPLHSTVDPKREARRLVESLVGKSPDISGFWVFLGLGAGFAPEAALQTAGVSRVIVIEYDITGIVELFHNCKYDSLLEDPRFTLLADPSPDLIEKTVLDMYLPALHGGIKTLPLRARTDQDKNRFYAAAEAVQRAVEKVSSDYSVQAYFGTRWFVNTIHNLRSAWKQKGDVPEIHDAAICAAGPSLDDQIPLLAEQREKAGSQKLFVISTDTALPALLSRGFTPDAVVSIDCQHISYRHFMGTGCRNIPLFMDISSPPVLAEFSDFPFFFSGGHPLAAYVSQQWRPLPLLDTSGGNVTYACLSLAESLGAQRITVYGADFSYPAGRVYARGTYIYPFFEQKQERRFPLESRLASFLYRSPFLPAEDAEYSGGENSPRYETAALRLYRENFERKLLAMEAQVSAAPGRGIPLSIHRKPFSPFSGAGCHAGRIFSLFAPGKMLMDAGQFLEQYRDAIAALPVPGNTNGNTNGTTNGNANGNSAYLRNLGVDERRVFITLLPQMAAIRRRRPELATPGLIEAVKRYSVDEIERVLG